MREGSGDGAETCLPGTPVRVASPHRFEQATDPPVSEGRRSGSVRPVYDLWWPVVQPELRCSLRPRPLVDAEFPPAAFGMSRNLRPARQSMRQPFPSHNESVPELLLG